MDIDVVIIGLNAERTLAECIEGVLNSNYDLGTVRVVYVDGGSIDCSVSIASEYSEIKVIERTSLDPATPGWGRNAGWRSGNADYVQFLDSDTVLDPDWLKKAVSAMSNGAGIVCGALKEKYPDKNFYHCVADIEWQGDRTGEAITMIRRDALEESGGYLEELVVGEDPELINRLEVLGYKRLKIQELMALHDIGMNDFFQYWRRSRRTGYGYASIVHRGFKGLQSLWVKEFVRSVVRGGGGMALFALGVGMGLCFDFMYLWIALFGFFLLLYPRLFKVKSFMKMKNLPLKQAKRYSMHCSFVVIPQFFGILRYLMKVILNKMFRVNVYSSVVIALALMMSFIETGCTKIHKGMNCLPEEEIGSVCNPIPDEVFISRREQIKATYATEAEIEQFSEDVPFDYYMGPGDVFSVIVHGFPTASLSNIVVSPDGKAPLPRIGYFDVTGKTPDQLQELVRTKMAVFYESPEVTLMVHTYANNKVFVLGRVSNPGVLYFSGPGNLMEALSLSGGLPTIATDAFLSRCMIIRGQDTVIWVNLKELLSRGNIALNPKLMNNDIVFIPESDDEVVYVMGEVASPGIVRLKTSLTIMDAIMFSGGPTKDSSLERVYIVRNDGDIGYVEEIDIKKFIALGDLRKNYLLQDGDIVYVSTKPIENFNYFVSKISPAVRLLNVGVVTAEDIKDFGSNSGDNNN